MDRCKIEDRERAEAAMACLWIGREEREGDTHLHGSEHPNEYSEAVFEKRMDKENSLGIQREISAPYFNRSL